MACHEIFKIESSVNYIKRTFFKVMPQGMIFIEFKLQIVSVQFSSVNSGVAHSFRRKDLSKQPPTVQGRH